MNKNRGLAVLLAALMCVSLAACGDKTASEEKDTKETTTTTAAQESKAEETTTAPAETTTAPAETTPAETVEETKELPPEQTPTEEETKSAELNEIGKMDAENVGFYNDIMYKGTSEEDLECLDYKGEKIDGGDVPMVDKLDDTGLYSFCKKGKDIVYTGLMDEEGNVVLDADQGCGGFVALNDRFLKAYFPEEVTKDKDEAIFYTTENPFSTQPGDEDILYKGHVKVYDIKTGKFLENTSQTVDPFYTINDDIISFYDTDDELRYVNAEDKILDLGSATPAGSFITEYKDGKCVVYDHDMNTVITSDNSVFALDNTDYYYRLLNNETNKSGIMSKMGRTIIEPKYDGIFGINDKYFQYTSDDKYGLLKDDGTEITKAVYKNIVAVCPGYFKASDDDNKSYLIDKTGKEIFKESGDDSLYALDEAPYAKIGDEYCYLVYGTGEMSLKFENTGEYFGHGLLYVYQEKTIYNLQTGEKVLDGFDKANVAYDHLYILDGDEYTIYEIK